MKTLKEVKARFKDGDIVAGDFIVLDEDGRQVSIGSVHGDSVLLSPEGETSFEAKRVARAAAQKNPTSSVLTEVTAQSGEATSRGEGAEPAGEPEGQLAAQTGEPITKTEDGESKAKVTPAGKKAGTTVVDGSTGEAVDAGTKAK